MAADVEMNSRNREMWSKAGQSGTNQNTGPWCLVFRPILELEKYPSSSSHFFFVMFCFAFRRSSINDFDLGGERHRYATA